jgi:hypothetical protein
MKNLANKLEKIQKEQDAPEVLKNAIKKKQKVVSNNEKVNK